MFVKLRSNTLLGVGVGAEVGDVGDGVGVVGAVGLREGDTVGDTGLLEGREVGGFVGDTVGDVVGLRVSFLEVGSAVGTGKDRNERV